TGGFPMVIGRFIQDAAFPTVTVYNHLDVQPADGEGWRTPPFKLMRDATVPADQPARWYARGATDDKGPALTALYGARLAIETGAKDVHSGTTGGLARNPIGELAALVADCYDARTGKVKIPGFYAGVRKLSAAERKAFKRARFSRKRFAAAHELGSLRPIRDD